MNGWIQTHGLRPQIPETMKKDRFSLFIVPNQFYYNRLWQVQNRLNYCTSISRTDNIIVELWIFNQTGFDLNRWLTFVKTYAF